MKLWYNWKINHCIACPEAGYPLSEARYDDFLDWLLAQLGWKEY